MRRWTFYLFVGLSALGIGLFFAGKFYWVENIRSTEGKGLPVDDSPVYACPILPDVEDNEVSDVCSGISNEDYFETAINRWLKGKKLGTKPMRPPKEYRSDGDEYTASLIAANHDGKKDLLIKAYCSPVKNCRVFIYEKQRGDFQEIFFSRTGIQEMNFEKTSSKQYRDIRAKTKLNEKTGFYSTYKFDKGFYDTTECAEYKIDKSGKESTTPIECYLVDDGEK